MTLRISGKSISVGEALRERVSERTEEVLRKFFDGNYSVHITLSKDGFGFRTDCSLHLDSGITIAEATTTLKRLSVSEAVMELDLTGAACLVFQHGSSGRVNVIYRRSDGNVGWVDPPAVESRSEGQ